MIDNFSIKYWVWKLVVYYQWFVSIFNFCNDCYHKTLQRWSILFRWWNWSKSVISLKSTDLYSYSEWNFCDKELDKRYWNQFFWTSFNIFCDKELQKIPQTKSWISLWQRIRTKNCNKQNPWISLPGMCPPPLRPDASQDYPSGWIIIPFFHQKPNELRNYLVRFLAKRCLRWCMIVTLCMSQQRPEKSGFLWKPG